MVVGSECFGINKLFRFYFGLLLHEFNGRRLPNGKVRRHADWNTK